jgi:hypothetical protein
MFLTKCEQNLGLGNTSEVRKRRILAKTPASRPSGGLKKRQPPLGMRPKRGHSASRMSNEMIDIAPLSPLWPPFVQYERRTVTRRQVQVRVARDRHSSSIELVPTIGHPIATLRVEAGNLRGLSDEEE